MHCDIRASIQINKTHMFILSVHVGVDTLSMLPWQQDLVESTLNLPKDKYDALEFLRSYSLGTLATRRLLGNSLACFKNFLIRSFEHVYTRELLMFHVSLTGP